VAHRATPRVGHQRQWLSFDGWYSTPQGPRPEGQPPTHSMLNATIQSKFLPTFRSGIFN
jgi:hypothetical protein